MRREIINHYQKTWRSYDKWFDTHKALYQSKLAALRKVVHSGTGLEIGVGTGRFAAPLDAVRFRWSRIPLILKGFSFGGLILSLIIIFWAFRENAYLSQFVRIQEDRGHKVCTTGPYKFVRHPMYFGIIILVLCLPLFLG